MNSTTMDLKSSGPITKNISAPGLIKHYGNLRYTFKRPIPTAEEINLSREEDYFHPEETPLSQQVLRNKVMIYFTIFIVISARNSNLVFRTIFK